MKFALRMIYLFLFVLMGSAVYADTGGFFCESSDAASSMMSSAEGIACQQEYQNNKCEKFKNSLEESERSNVIDCNNLQKASNWDLVISCGEGVVTFAVDAVKGTVEIIKAAPEFVANIPKMTYELGSNIATGLTATAEWYQQCETDLELRRQVFAPIAMLYPPDQQKAVIENVRCEGLAQMVSTETMNANNDIASKRQLQKQFADRYPDRTLPAHLELTAGEREFLRYQAEASDVRRGENLIEKALAQARGRLQCYTPQAQAQMTCEILAELGSYAVGGALISGVRRSKAIQGIISDSVDSIKKGKDAVKVGGKAPLAGREAYLARNLEKSVTSPKQNAEWIATADKVTSSDGYKFLEVENSMMKTLNDELKDKNLVTSLTNRHKELTYDEVQKIVAKNPGLKVESYSDFKSVRFAFSGKVPEDLNSQLNLAFSKANKEFANEVKDLGIVADASKADTWFRAGMGSTADEASNVARVARTQGSSNALLNLDQPGVKARLKSDLDKVEGSRGTLETKWGSSSLMMGESGKKIPTAEVFEILRKSSDPAVVAKEIKRRTGVTNFTEKDASQLIAYGQSVDSFNPSLRILKREVSNLDTAANGGFSADFGGLGARNTHATAKALAGEGDYSAALVGARNGERAVTADIKNRMDVFKKAVGDAAKCSGDDCVGIATKPLTASNKLKIVESLASSDDTRAIRVAFVNKGVKDPAHRTLLSTHGESIEKILRQELSESIPYSRSKDFTFGIDMQTTKLNTGKVDIFVGSKPGAVVTAAEEKAIKEALNRAVKKFNNDLGASGTKATYTAP